MYYCTVYYDILVSLIKLYGSYNYNKPKSSSPDELQQGPLMIMDQFSIAELAKAVIIFLVFSNYEVVWGTAHETINAIRLNDKALKCEA